MAGISRGEHHVRSPSKEIPILGDTYKFGEKLGTGGYSIVYKAFNIKTGNFVAVKRIQRKKANEKSLEAEVKLLKSLHHENIVLYVDLIVTTNHLNLVLEFIEGGSLAQVIEKFGVFPEPLAALYIQQVLSGLDYLHKNGVTHRDIKGPNLLITKEGVVKLTDFGIARIASANGDSTLMSSAANGSPFWMAPEVIQNQSSEPPCDIWSVGCTVIELLTGFPPYYDSAVVNALYKMVQEDHPPFPEDISKEVLSFLEQTLQKDCSKRSTAKELLSHPWIVSSVSQFGEKKSSWKNTVERVKKFNTKTRKATLSKGSIKNFDWQQQQPPKEEKGETDEKKTTVKITGTETRKNFLYSFTVFRVEVIIFHPQRKQYTVSKSYNDFKELEANLRGAFPEDFVSFPTLPTMKWFGNTDPEYVSFLNSGLQNFLNFVVVVPGDRKSVV